MVLSDLGRKLNAALSSLNRVSVVDEKVAWIRSPRAMYSHILGSRCTLEGGLRCTPRI